MININFTQEEIEALNYERYNYPHPKVQKKIEVLYLKSQGLAHNEIRRLCRISKTTLTTYLKQYIGGGIETLKKINHKGQPSKLWEHASTIEEYFKKNPPSTVAEAQAVIEDLTGIKRSPTQIRIFMKKLGLKFLKMGFVPGKAITPEKIKEQDEFQEEDLEPRLEEAKEEKRVVFFVDAAHFIYKAYLSFIWCFARTFISSPSGRKRFNVLGALNAVTKEIITITNETYINADSVCQLLRKISELGIKVPITLVLDNARYQKCLLVQSLAENLNIELLYLPSYSPHLNLIERYWKFLRKKCLYSKYYADFQVFKNEIENCISDSHIKYKKNLNSLLTWNFQSFKNVQVLAA